MNLIDIAKIIDSNIAFIKREQLKLENEIKISLKLIKGMDKKSITKDNSSEMIYLKQRFIFSEEIKNLQKEKDLETINLVLVRLQDAIDIVKNHKNQRNLYKNPSITFS